MKNIPRSNRYNGGSNPFTFTQYVPAEPLGQTVRFKAMGNINTTILIKFIYFKSRSMLRKKKFRIIKNYRTLLRTLLKR